MRLPTNKATTTEKPAKPSTPSASPVSTAKGSGSAPAKDAAPKPQAVQPQPVSAAAPAPAVDYTRPSNTTELLADLQRRVIELEKFNSRHLKAGEYAIVIEMASGRSLDQWKQAGYVAQPCSCSNIGCKGWRLVAAETAREGLKPSQFDKRDPEVKVTELKDVIVPPTPEQTAKIKAGLAKEWHENVFKKMLKQGKVEQQGDTTLIPKDGPINWTHEEHLAFAHAFEMTELLELKDKPRELQRRLIAALREIGYDILSAPEKKK